MSGNIYPTTFSWDGDNMTPISPKIADKQYVVGETYRLAPHEERSYKSHGHYFAMVNEAWQNLPEHLAERFPTSEHLRKFALIRAGYRDERTIALSTNEDAERVATLARPLDDYAVVLVNDNIVTVFTAKSQSMKAMGKRVFQESKDKVLDELSRMMMVDPEALKKNAGQAA